MTIPENLQYQLPYVVGSFQVHPDGKISLTSLANLLQEIAWKQADSADFGRNLHESKQMWVLARLEIKVVKFPKWGEQIHLFTGGRGVDKLFAFREFLICDQNELVLARAMSSWLLLNSETKRILKSESVLPPELFDRTKKPDWQPGKIAVSGDLIASEVVSVRFSDLDLNYHVNNTSYIRWVENLIFDHGIQPDSLAINYLSESVVGDRVLISLYKGEIGFLVEGRVGDKLVFTAKV